MRVRDWYFDSSLPYYEITPYHVNKLERICSNRKRVWIGLPIWYLESNVPKETKDYLYKNFYEIPFRKFRLFYKNDDKTLEQKEEIIELLKEANRLSPDFAPLQHRLISIINLETEKDNKKKW